jgi:hypothetical protein
MASVEATSKPRAVAPVVRVKAAAHARSSRPSRPKPLAAPEPTTSQESWEQQQQDYQRARASYDANERMAGFRWAQQNNIKTVRYCRVASLRTVAFVEGCMNYVRPGRTGGSTKPRDAVDAVPPEQG